MSTKKADSLAIRLLEFTFISCYNHAVVKRTRAVHPAFVTAKERGDAMSVSDAVSLIGCVLSLLSLLISVYLLGRDR